MTDDGWQVETTDTADIRDVPVAQRAPKEPQNTLDSNCGWLQADPALSQETEQSISAHRWQSSLESLASVMAEESQALS